MTFPDHHLLAQQLNLDPRPTSTGESRCKCPGGCSNTKTYKYSASLNVTSGHIKCWKCDGGWHTENLGRGAGHTLPTRAKPPKVEPPKNPINMPEAWDVLDKVKPRFTSHIIAWAKRRGWPQELCEEIAKLRGVTWAPDKPIGSPEADRLRMQSHKGCMNHPLLIALCDPDGMVRSAMRRYVSDAPTGRPKCMRVKKSLAPIRTPIIGDLGVLATLSGGAPILFVEGETDWMAAAGMAASDMLPITGAFGAPSRTSLTPVARAVATVLQPGTRIVCVPDIGDADDAGERDMEKAARVLAKAGHVVSIWRLPPGSDGKADLAQTLEDAGIDTLRELLHTHMQIPVDPIPPKKAPSKNTSNNTNSGAWTRRHACTDVGNRERFVDAHGESVRYLKAFKSWHLWDEVRWKRDEEGQVQELAIETVKAIKGEAEDLTEEGLHGIAEAFFKHANTSQSKGKIDAMISLASTHPAIRIRPDDLDKDPWLLGTPSGVVDLRTGDLRPARRDDNISQITGVPYDPDAQCPTWDAFILSVMGGDLEMAEYIQRAVGYSLTGVTDEQCLFLLHGYGRNGKSTFLEIILDIFGDYGTNAEFDSFLERRSEGPRNDLAALKGARFVAASEPDKRKRIDEAFIKHITGSEKVKARFLNQEFFTFTPQFALWLAANHKPRISGTDDGIWRRLKLLPFEVQFTTDKDRAKGKTGPPVDKGLLRKLRKELPGILVWAINGCLWWQEEGLCEPEKVAMAGENYREEMDAIGAFLEECCVRAPGLSTKAKIIYTAYSEWCKESGETAMTMRSFGQTMAERGIEKKRQTAGWHYLDLGLEVVNVWP